MAGAKRGRWICDTTRDRMVAHQSVWPRRAKLSTQLRPEDRVGNEAEPSWDLPNQATPPRMNCCSNFRVAFCCHPNFGWLGSGFASHTGGTDCLEVWRGIIVRSSIPNLPQRGATWSLAKGGAVGEPTIVRMQLHTSSSWRTATALHQKFALGEPHINRSNHAACGSTMADVPGSSSPRSAARTQVGQ